MQRCIRGAGAVSLLDPGAAIPKCSLRARVRLDGLVSIWDGPAVLARQLPALDRSEALRLIGDKPAD
ncbi:MAG: hypothetical protein B7Z29_10060 [Hyphomicrobium sp. 12-62-95]|nr:MAG: hypothetical protein B7Z29_10060 [Hyphomicrobium sp. 12-62-95]